MQKPLVGICPKQEVEDRDSKTDGSSFQYQLGPKTRETELRLGLAPNDAEKVCGENLSVLNPKSSGLGTKRWFSETENGFGDPWKDEQGVFAHSNRPHLVNAPPVLRAFPVVGWPPVRTFRKNLGPQAQPKAEMETKAKTATVIEAPKKFEDSMYVKVSMEGYAVGRKINLKAYDGYESLSLALQKMFYNFLSVNCFKNQQQHEEVGASTDHVLIYEDNEGDRMLVGDIPWEMFIITVKRLYIINGSNAPTVVAGNVEKNQQ